MKTLKNISVLGLLFLLSLMLNCSKESATEPEPHAIDSFQTVLDNDLETHDGTGVSAAVVFQNQDVWTGTSGVSFGTTAITEDMLFNIGSVTKTFIAALCLQLVDEGVFSLEDSLHEWLPDYPNVDNTITIRQLLYNTSGIYNVTDNSDLWSAVFNDPERCWTPDEVITTFVDEPYAAPGAGWFYSNTNYILLGKIINAATGSLVSAELRTRFFEPLGLNSTFFDVEETIPSTIAHGWFDISGDGSYDDMSLISRTGIYSALWTASAIFSTAEDLAKWSSALFRGDVLGQSSLDQMLTPCCTLPGTTDVGCGMGVFLLGPGNNAGVELVGYTGRTFGYLTSMFFVPDYGISVVVVINDDNVACLDAITTDLILKAMGHGSS